MVPRCRAWRLKDWARVSPLPLLSCLPLGKSLYVSEEFPQLCKGEAPLPAVGSTGIKGESAAASLGQTVQCSTDMGAAMTPRTRVTAMLWKPAWKPGC